MLKKLSQFISSFFSRENPAKTTADYIDVYAEAIKVLVPQNGDILSGAVEKINEKETISMNLDTGKIIFPEGISEEDKAELELALQELNNSLQNLAPEDMYKSLEDFISKVSNETQLWDGLTPMNSEEFAFFKMEDELEFCEDQTQHWSNDDFLSSLYHFEQQGYEFLGIEELYRKSEEKLEFNKEDEKKLREWYKLAAQGNVYEV